jgi:hypothetical protein
MTVGRLAPIVAGGLVVATLAVGTAPTTAVGFDAEHAALRMRQLNRQAAAASPSTTVAPAAAPGAAVSSTPVPAPSVAMFGDSISLSIAYSLNPWSLRSGQIHFVGGDTEMGCGIGRGGREDGVSNAPRSAECNGWQPRWQTFVDTYQPDVAVVQSSQWELVDRMLKGDDRWRTLGDPVYDDYLRSELLAATDVLSSDGALVMWVSVPYFSHLDDDSLPSGMRRSHDPTRVDRLNEIIREVVAARPDHARLIDLADWMSDKVDDATLRRDGAHFNDSGAERIASDFFGPQLVSIWQDWVRSRAGIGGG